MTRQTLIVVALALAGCGGASTPGLQGTDQDPGGLSDAQLPDAEISADLGDARESDIPATIDVAEVSPDVAPLDTAEDSCRRSCQDRECGDDGCGGTCGTCTDGKVCQAGTCACAADDHKACCAQAVCWFDSCGAQGTKVVDCPFGCKEGACEACVPQCSGKECGEDGCGKDCGTCTVGSCAGLKWTPVATCPAGTCIPGQVQDCDDGNPCTVDTCDPNAGCSRRNVDTGTTCVAGACVDVLWTKPITCIAGQCIGGGGSLQCVDGNDCTDDTCSPALGCAFPSNSKACDDSDPCTIGDTCQSGDCRGTGPLDCDDQNACTLDSCVKAVGCKHDPVNEGKVCSSGFCAALDWTKPSTCAGGQCIAQAGQSCDDQMTCTTDSCDPTIGCVNAVQQGKCLIEGMCHSEAQTNAANACQVCTPATNRTAWSAKSCDDGKTCTTNTCSASTGCINTALAGNCLIAGTCYLTGNKNPLNVCQTCTPATNTTTWSPAIDGGTCAAGSCSGLTWTKPSTCLSGQCNGGGGTQSCNDGLVCTTDSCTATGCRSVLIAGNCLIDGACYTNGQVNPLNPCQFCTTSKSTTTWSNGTDGVQCLAASCADLTLTLPKKCASGQCVGTTQSCNDGLACTTDSCSTSTGCANVLLVGNCVISGSCYADGQADPSASCSVCNTAKSTAFWCDAPAGTQCQAGSCSFQAYTTPKTCNNLGDCVVGGTVGACVSTACSVATCDDATGCTQVVQGANCLIGGTCYQDGYRQSATACKVCNNGMNPLGWSNVSNGTTCGTNKWCQAGSCVCQPQCEGKQCGSDGCGGSCGTGCNGLYCYGDQCVTCLPRGAGGCTSVSPQICCSGQCSGSNCL